MAENLPTGFDPLANLDLAKLRKRTSEKWRAYPADVLPMFIAEMDCDLAPAAITAVQNALELGDTGYVQGYEYAEAISRYAQHRWHTDCYNPEYSVLVSDVMHGIMEALSRCTAPGGPVILNDPVYPPFFLDIDNIGRQVVEVPLTEEYRLDFVGLEQAFAKYAPQGAAYLLCNPQNPTGTVHTRDELQQVVALATKYNIPVVVDEIHAPLIAQEVEFVPYLSLDGVRNAFVMFSASKAWNLAGIKAAAMFSTADNAELIAKLRSTHGLSPSQLGVISHIAVLDGARQWLLALVDSVDRNKRLLQQLLKEQAPAIKYQYGPATYLAWLDCRDLNLPYSPAEFFLKEAKIALNPGETFGTKGTGFVRMNLCTSPEIIAEGVRRISAAL